MEKAAGQKTVIDTMYGKFIVGKYDGIQSVVF